MTVSDPRCHRERTHRYDRIAKAVRAVDDDRLIFFAGVTWDDFGVGFSHPPGGAEYAERVHKLGAGFTAGSTSGRPSLTTASHLALWAI